MSFFFESRVLVQPQKKKKLTEFIAPTKTTFVRGKADVSCFFSRGLCCCVSRGEEYDARADVENDDAEEEEEEEKPEYLRGCCCPPTLPASFFPFLPPSLLPPLSFLLFSPTPPRSIFTAAAVSLSPSADVSPAPASAPMRTTASASAGAVACGGSPQTPLATRRPTEATLPARQASHPAAVSVMHGYKFF